MGAAQYRDGLKPAVEETARRYAGRLLSAAGLADAAGAVELPDEHPVVAAARCGLMMLTGDAGLEAELCPAPIAACADGVLAALAAVAPPAAFNGLRGSQLLTERAAITGHARNGAISPNGSCRLLRASDGRIALNLPRADDWGLLEAWLETEVGSGWDGLAERVAVRSVGSLVERGRTLGLAVADAVPFSTCGRGSRVAGGEGLLNGLALSRPCGPPSPARGRGEKPPLVVDLSSLWAGPLCTHLLQCCGAEVIKIESLHRPDGARHGVAAFFDLMNAGKRSVALDFGSGEGRAALLALLRRADIVVEASRPRALRQLGIDAEALVAADPRKTWISLTGYGRTEPNAQWIAYGDDAGVAGGLSAQLHAATGRWLICGDAIADPLAGLHAAFAAWSGWQRGGGGLVDIALVDVVRGCADFETAGAPHARRRQWMQQLIASRQRVQAPQARTAVRAAALLGADTDAVLAGLGIELARAC
ncbi:CoA transferase [Hydrocarboniphaga sp.]|uniref:CoA transferase n=1 Tax=Hydrocarboniphaga sp. TaxID=2033016 RepID=UPI003D0AE9CB